MEIPLNDRLIILNRQLGTWRNTYVDARYAAGVWDDLGRPEKIEHAAQRMKDALQAIAWLERKITEVEGGDKNESVLG